MLRLETFLDVATLLNHGEQYVVAFVKQGHFVAHLLELHAMTFAFTWAAIGVVSFENARPSGGRGGGGVRI